MQHGSQAVSASQSALMVQTGFVSTMLTGEDLGIDGKKSRTISFWTYVEDGNPRSEPGFYGYGERACPGENRYWAIRNIKDGGYTQFLSQHWCWDPRVYHNNDSAIVGHIFAHLFNGSQVMVYVDGSLVAEAGLEVKSALAMLIPCSLVVGEMMGMHTFREVLMTLESMMPLWVEMTSCRFLRAKTSVKKLSNINSILRQLKTQQGSRWKDYLLV